MKVKTYPVRAGRLVRRDIRAAFDFHGFRYREHKGFLDSVFLVEVPDDRRKAWAELSLRIEKLYDD